MAQIRFPHRRRWPTRVALGIGIGAAVLLILAVLTAFAAVPAAADLRSGQRELREGRRLLTFGNVDDAQASFELAAQHFDEAAHGLGAGLSSIMSRVPLLGRNLEVAEGAALAGRELALAGGELTRGAAALPDGLGSLAPTGGALPLDAYADLQDDLDAAAARAARAQELLAATPSTLLVRPVADARAEALDEVTHAARVLDAGGDLLREIPSFMGAEGPRSYFFVAESPAELRGTGGIWGAWAIATAEDGRFMFSPFQPIQRLDDIPADQVPAPNPDFARNYDQYGGAGYWRNMNMTPDFPSASRAVLASYEILTGQELDGVISADPFALAAMLELTGPVEIPGLGIEVDSESVVDFVSNEAYIRFGGESVERKAVLGSVAGDAFVRFLGMQERGVARMRTVAELVATGHLKIYSADEQMQAGLELAGADHGLRAEGDVVAVIVNNRSGSKVDYYARRTVEHRVQLGGDAEAISRTLVEIDNEAPLEKLPGHVTEPLVEGAERGDNIALVTIGCHDPCQLVQAELNGAPEGVRGGTELGIPWYSEYFTIPAGERGVLNLTTRTSGVWQGNSTGGTYRLTYLGQHTVEPAVVTIEIVSPSGTRVTWASHDMAVNGDTATWKGTPGARLELEIRFGAPIPLSWWRNLARLP